MVGIAIFRAVGSQLWIWCAVGTMIGLAFALLGIQEPEAAAAGRRAAAAAPAELTGDPV